MEVKLGNKKFIIKVHYGTELKETKVKDQWNRTIWTEWLEPTTNVSVYQWTNGKYDTKTVVTGSAHCNYKDKYNKQIGRKLAYYNAVTRLLELKIVTEAEAAALDRFELNMPSVDLTPTLKLADIARDCVKLDKATKSQASCIDKMLADSIYKKNQEKKA